MVDLVGQLGIEVAERIVRQPSQVEDCIEAAKVGELYIAYILLDRGYGWNPTTEGTPPKQVGIKTNGFMPC